MNNNYEEDYLNLLTHIVNEGTRSENRTGVDTYKIWGTQIHINLQEGFPLLTTKKIHWKGVVHELLWMIKGDTNIKYLLDNGVTFWTEWPYKVYKNTPIDDLKRWECAGSSEQGVEVHFTQKQFEDCIRTNDAFAKKWGSIGDYGYGGMWRKFPSTVHPIGYHKGDHMEVYGWEINGIDQVKHVIEQLQKNPDDRRIIITSWHPHYSNNEKLALLPACHNYVQFGTEKLTWTERIQIAQEADSKNENMYYSYSDNDLNEIHIPNYKLNCYFNMRSTDTFLGLPFNCAFYALLTHLIANNLNMIPNHLVYSGADVHVYSNHLEQVNLQVNRKPKHLPRLNIKERGKSIFNIKFDDIELLDYNPDSSIKADIAV